MKTNKTDLSRLRNDEHFKFFTDFDKEITAADPNVLQVVADYNAFKQNFAKEDAALKKVMKSEFTEGIHDADKKRDDTFRGLVDTNMAALHHFNPSIVAAAKRLKILFDTYGNVSKKPANEETSAIINLLQDLKGKYANDIIVVKLDDWVNELEDNNNDFDTLFADRYDETNLRNDSILREVRADVDANYNNIIDRIDALALVAQNTQPFIDFIHKWNVIVDKYNNTIAQRRGRNKIKN